MRDFLVEWNRSSRGQKKTGLDDSSVLSSKRVDVEKPKLPTKKGEEEEGEMPRCQVRESDKVRCSQLPEEQPIWFWAGPIFIPFRWVDSSLACTPSGLPKDPPDAKNEPLPIGISSSWLIPWSSSLLLLLEQSLWASCALINPFHWQAREVPAWSNQQRHHHDLVRLGI